MCLPALALFAHSQAVPSDVVCALAIQAGIEGNMPAGSSASESCSTVEQCEGAIEFLEEQISDDEEQLNTELSSLQELLKDPVECSCKDTTDVTINFCNLNDADGTTNNNIKNIESSDIIDGLRDHLVNTSPKPTEPNDCKTSYFTFHFDITNVTPIAEDCNEEEACDYYLYKKHFKRKGKVDRNKFCKSYEGNDDLSMISLLKDPNNNESKNDCKDFLEYAEELSGYIHDSKKEIEKLKDKIRQLDRRNRQCSRPQNANNEECQSPSTEAGSFCIPCFNAVVEAHTPKKSAWEKAADYLLPAASLLLGYRGIRRNNQRLQVAGFQPDTSAYARLGYPFAMSALYGANRGTGPCSSSVGGGGSQFSTLALLSQLGNAAGGPGGPFGINPLNPLSLISGLGNAAGGIFNHNALNPMAFLGEAGNPAGAFFGNNQHHPLSLLSQLGFAPSGASALGGNPFLSGLHTGGFNIGLQQRQLQIDAQQRAYTAYMEAMQVHQQRQMAKQTAIQGLWQQMQQIQVQIQRIATGYEGVTSNTSGLNTTVPLNVNPNINGITGGITGF